MEKIKLLLVDDEKVIRASLSRELRLAGYEVSAAEDGAKALEKIQENHFDAIITDLVMPDLDGISLLKAAKQLKPETSVLILTGYGDLGSAIDALRLGADDYLIKPCDTDELLHRLRNSLEKKDLIARLKKQNALLEEEVKKRRKVENELKENEQRFKLALDASSDGVWDRNLITGVVCYGENWLKNLGHKDQKFMVATADWEELIHPEDIDHVLQARAEHMQGKSSRYEVQYRIRNREGNWQWILSRGRIIERDQQGNPVRLVGTHTDITRLKQVEAELLAARSHLSQRVRERTAELEEINTALNVLLSKRERDRAKQEERIVNNVAELIEPFLCKLAESPLSREQQVYVDILKANISELTSSMAQNVAARFSRLTPAEVQIANLVKIGKRTKDIAEIMNLSPGTINVHRKNIRKKLNLTNRKANLQTILSSYS